MNNGAAMKERLRNLVSLQEIDSEIIAIKRKVSRLPEELKRRNEALEEKRSRLQIQLHNLTTVQLDNKELEIEISGLNASVTRNQERLLEVKNQREYQAVKNQLASLKADLKHSEDAALEIMEQMEKVKETAEKHREEIAAEEALIAEMKVRSEDEIASVKNRIDGLKRERELIVPLIDPQDYEYYKKLMRPPDYIALAPVKATGGLCSACNVQIEFQTMNRLYIGKEMILCSNCTRILYLPEAIS